MTAAVFAAPSRPSSLPTNGLVFHLDAGNASSYTGSGDWKNLVSSPADSETQVTYDHTNNGATFNGSSGGLSSSEYWSFDGSSAYFSKASNTTFLNSLHKDSAAFSFVTWVRTPASISGTNGIFGTHNATSTNIGISLSMGGSSLDLYVGNGTGVQAYSKNFSFSFASSTIYLIACALDEVTGSIQFYIRSGTKTTSASSVVYSSPSASNSLSAFNIGAVGGGNTKLGNNFRMYKALMYNRKLTEQELDGYYNFDGPRFGLS